jgi:RND superfamily putative drug exporter
VDFGTYIGETDRLIKLYGVGHASAELLDATEVLMVQVPATIELHGDRNWWLPGWLDRILPNIDVEGHSIGEDGADEDSPTIPGSVEPALG